MLVRTRSGMWVTLSTDLILNSIGVEEDAKIKKWKAELQGENAAKKKKEEARLRMLESTKLAGATQEEVDKEYLKSLNGLRKQLSRDRVEDKGDKRGFIAGMVDKLKGGEEPKES